MPRIARTNPVGVITSIAFRRPRFAETRSVPGTACASRSSVRRAGAIVATKMLPTTIANGSHAKRRPKPMSVPPPESGSRTKWRPGRVCRNSWPTARTEACQITAQVPNTTGSKSRFHALFRRLALCRASSRYPIAALHGPRMWMLARPTAPEQVWDRVVGTEHDVESRSVNLRASTQVRDREVDGQIAFSSFERRRLLNDNGVPVSIDEVIERRDLVVHVRVYRMTSSACNSSDCGIVRPIAFAVLRLIASSNFVGCSTGRSEGFAPLRILST